MFVEVQSKGTPLLNMRPLTHHWLILVKHDLWFRGFVLINILLLLSRHIATSATHSFKELLSHNNFWITNPPTAFVLLVRVSAVNWEHFIKAFSFLIFLIYFLILILIGCYLGLTVPVVTPTRLQRFFCLLIRISACCGWWTGGLCVLIRVMWAWGHFIWLQLFFTGREVIRESLNIFLILPL